MLLRGAQALLTAFLSSFCAFLCFSWLFSAWHIGLVWVSPRGKSASLDDAALHDRQESVTLFQQGNVRQHVALHDQHVGQLAQLQRPKFVSPAEDLRARLCGALDRVERA